MKKLVLLLFLSSFLCLSVKETDAQVSRTAPSFIAGLSLNGNFANNDFYGTSNTYIAFPAVNDFNAMWGRGASLYAKFGLGQRRVHAITIEGEFNQMLNNNTTGKTPFMQNPEAPHTFYHIITGAAGYEHRFYARCRDKFTMGFALSVNNINTPTYSSLRFESGSVTKVGIQLTAGYEMVLDAANKWGLRIGARYHVLNPFDTSNENVLVNDVAKGYMGANWGRKLGVLSLNVGINMYSGY